MVFSPFVMAEEPVVNPQLPGERWRKAGWGAVWGAVWGPLHLAREARAEDHRFQGLVLMISYHEIQRNRSSALRYLILKP